jgi:hypothetical protein
MDITELLQAQMKEALGSVNKWYCSQHYGYDVHDPEILLAYYIKHGGATHYREFVNSAPAPQLNLAR